MRFEGKLKKAHEANKTTCIFFNLVCALIVPLVGYVRIKLALKQQLVYRQPGVRMHTGAALRFLHHLSWSCFFNTK